VNRTIKDRIQRILDSNVNERIRTNILQAIPFWIASGITGLAAVAYTRLFNASEVLLQKTLQWHDWLIFIAAPLNFLLAYYIVKIFAPTAGGSGIPQVMAAIHLSSAKHEKSVFRLLNLRVAATKIVSCILMVLGGGAIGREGPTIQIAGSVFRSISKRIPKSWPRLSERSFILTGAAAGLAAAFNTPLGGIVFAIEELAKIHISSIRTALFTAVIIAGLTAQGLLGPYLYLGYPDVQNLKGVIFFGVIITAGVTGLMGGLMSKTTFKLLSWRKKLTNVRSILWIIFSGLVVASIAYFLNDGILGSGKDLMNQVLFSNQKHVGPGTAIVRTIGPIFSFGVGASGGIFAPSLAAGAAIGSYLAGIGGIVAANANIIILSGMVGFLTGVTRTPFTSAILVLEMTDRHSVIFHLMLAALVSNIVAMLVDKHSLYERLKAMYIDEARQSNTSSV